jgi:hypothetical protein
MIAYAMEEPRLVEDRRSVDEYIIELLRQKGAQTLDHLGASLPNVNWARLFLAIDRLSRTGIIAIAPPQQGEYLISLTSDPSYCPVSY